MSIYISASALCAACIIGSTGIAQTYTCSLEESRNSGWLPEVLVVQINPDGKSAKAFDEITYSTLNRFADVEVQAENSVRVEMRWETGRYRNTTAMASRDMPNATPVRIEYRATLLRGGNKMLLRATPEGNQGRFAARGACKSVETDIEQVVQR